MSAQRLEQAVDKATKALADLAAAFKTTQTTDEQFAKVFTFMRNQLVAAETTGRVNRQLGNAAGGFSLDMEVTPIGASHPSQPIVVNNVALPANVVIGADGRPEGRLVRSTGSPAMPAADFLDDEDMNDLPD